jgi:hypothetical protein
MHTSGLQTGSNNASVVNSTLQETISYPIEHNSDRRTPDSIFEPLPMTIRSPNPTLDSRILDNTQSFLDGLSNGAHHDWTASSGMLPLIVGEAEIVSAEPSAVNLQDDGFPYYYDDTPNDPSAPPTDQLHESGERSHPHIDEINPGHIAALLFILEHSESCAQSSNSGTQANMAQQLAHVSALSRAQFETLSNRLKSSIDAIAERLGFRDTSVSLGDSSATMHTFPDRDLEAVTAVLQDAAWMTAAPPNIQRQAEVSLDVAEEDPFFQTEWDDLDLVNWEPHSPTPQLQEVV